MTQRSNLLYVSVICAIVICMFWPAKIDGQAPQQIQNYTLMYKCDIVLILDESGSISDDDFARMLPVVQKFPDYFVMGENYSRVAIIAFSDESRIMLNLTADADLVRSFWMVQMNGGTATNLALQDAKDKVLVHSRQRAMKIVILLTDGIGPSQAEAVAKELRDRGTLIYVAYIGTTYRTDDGIKLHVDKVAGSSSHVFPIDDFNKLTAAIYEKIIPVIKCEFQEGCRFSDSTRETCVGEYWRMTIDDGNCTNVLPSEPPSWICVLSECNATCSEWPWEEKQDRECRDEDAGKNLTVNRGPMPTEKSRRMFEHCPEQKVVKTCPPKSTTTTTTSSPAPETTTIDPSTETPPHVVDPNVSTSGAAAVEWWVILLAIIFALVILAAIVALVMVTTRKRRKKAEKAALMAKKRAAMEKEKVSSSDPPSTISGRSPMGKGRVPTQMTQFGYGKGAADHSVQVSLATPTSSVRKSVDGKAAESASTRPAAKKSTSTNASDLKKAASAGKKK